MRKGSKCNERGHILHRRRLEDENDIRVRRDVLRLLLVRDGCDIQPQTTSFGFYLNEGIPSRRQGAGQRESAVNIRAKPVWSVFIGQKARSNNGETRRWNLSKEQRGILRRVEGYLVFS